MILMFCSVDTFPNLLLIPTICSSIRHYKLFIICFDSDTISTFDDASTLLFIPTIRFIH